MINVNDLYSVIGKLSVGFQHIETILGLLIGRLMGTEKHIGSIISSQLSFRKLCELCGTLYRYRIKDENEITKFNLILQKLDKIAEERNTIIHSLLAIDIENNEATFIKIKPPRGKDFEVKYKDANVSELNSLIDTMNSTNKELFNLYIELHKVLPFGERW